MAFQLQESLWSSSPLPAVSSCRSSLVSGWGPVFDNYGCIVDTTMSLFVGWRYCRAYWRASGMAWVVDICSAHVQGLVDGEPERWLLYAQDADGSTRLNEARDSSFLSTESGICTGESSIGVLLLSSVSILCECSLAPDLLSWNFYSIDNNWLLFWYHACQRIWRRSIRERFGGPV